MTKQLEEDMEMIANDLLECKTEVGQEMEKTNISMGLLKKEVELVKTDLADLVDKIDTLLAIITAGKGFFTVLGWIGTGIKRLTPVAVALLGAWYYITGHKGP